MCKMRASFVGTVYAWDARGVPGFIGTVYASNAISVPGFETLTKLLEFFCFH